MTICRSDKKPNYLNLEGQRFGQLVALEHIASTKHGHAKWKCACDCGNITYVPTNKLTSGRTQSCGHTKFGKRNGAFPARDNPRLYTVWLDIKGRCYNSNKDNFKYYGGKGITVCDEWIASFNTFCEWALANGYKESAKPGECTIDRIDPNGNYTPDNCRFVSQIVQANNTTANRYISYNGETKTLSEWARHYGIKWCTLKYRLDQGWGMDKAVNTPIRQGNYRGCNVS